MFLEVSRELFLLSDFFVASMLKVLVLQAL